MRVLKVKVISLPYIFQVLYVLCFSRPRYQVSVYRTIGPLVLLLESLRSDEVGDKFSISINVCCWYIYNIVCYSTGTFQ